MTKRIIILVKDNKPKYYTSLKILCECNPELSAVNVSRALKQKGIYWKNGYCVTREFLNDKKMAG